MIHLELQPEIEAQLAAEAQARGLALEKYIEQLVTGEYAEQEAAEAREGIREGLEQQRTGQGRPAAEFLDEMRAKYALAR